MSFKESNNEDPEQDEIDNEHLETVEVIETDLNDQEGELEELAAEIAIGDEDDDDEEEEARSIVDEAEEIEDNSLLTLNQHQGAVFTIDTFKNLIATGGEDDKACLWKFEKDESLNLKMDMLLETEKFEDSITQVKFSCDGKYLAVGEMNGKIRVYVVETKELHWSHDIEIDLETLSWHPSCNVLFCGTSDGNFIMFKLSTNEIKMMYSGDNASLNNFIILKDGKRAACCYSNGTIKIWDLKTSQPLFTLAKCHENDILCSDLSQDGNLLATAGLDMKVRFTNTINGKQVFDLSCESNKKIENETEQQNSIESVSFCKTMPLLACATVDGQIYVWDINTRTLRSKFDSKAGYTKIVWDQEILYASSLDGTLSSFDGRNLKLIKKFSGHKSEILDFSFIDNFLFTASDDKTIKVFDLN